MHMCICKQACKTGGVWGDAPPGNFLKLDALRLLLGPFLDKSRAVVASISSNFWLSYIHLLSQLTSNFHETKYLVWQNSRWGDINRTTGELSSA